jgi:hypothetical protein
MKQFFSKVISFLKWIYQPILKVAHFIGRINTAILLTIFYFFFLGFAKLTTIVLRKDPLDARWKDRQSYWKKREKFEIERNAFLEPY